MPDGCLFFRKNAENLTAEFPVMGALPFYLFTFRAIAGKPELSRCSEAYNSI